VEEFNGTEYQSGSLSMMNAGVGCYFLRSLSEQGTNKQEFSLLPPIHAGALMICPHDEFCKRSAAAC